MPQDLLHRYPSLKIVQSSMDTTGDLLSLIEALTSREVVRQSLSMRHSIASRAEVVEAAESITALVAQGLRFFEQAKSGPKEIQFLPLYYSVLQFAKAIVVARLGSAASGKLLLRHGVAYAPALKDSRSLHTERITIHPGGVLRGLYDATVGPGALGYPKSKRVFRMSSFYPYLFDASFEYAEATGDKQHFHEVVFLRRNMDDGTIRIQPKIAAPDNTQLPRTHLFHRLRREEAAFATADEATIALRTYMLYGSISYSLSDIESPSMYYYTPISRIQLQLPEEIPIFLAMFHMGSVVRYKPAFMAKVMDSRFSPFVLAVGRHCMTKWLLLFLSAMYRTSYVFNRR